MKLDSIKNKSLSVWPTAVNDFFNEFLVPLAGVKKKKMIFLLNPLSAKSREDHLKLPWLILAKYSIYIWQTDSQRRYKH